MIDVPMLFITIHTNLKVILTQPIFSFSTFSVNIYNFYPLLCVFSQNICSVACIVTHVFEDFNPNWKVFFIFY